jgi:outer membrane lipoprotein-sorting protein
MRRAPAAVLLLLGGSYAVSGPSSGDPATEARAVVEAMVRAADSVQDYTTVLVKQERLAGGLEPEVSFRVKWARPFRLYMKCLDGSGQEVLFVRGRNRDRIRVSRGSFPDLTLNLHPRGGFAMGKTHHPLSEASLLHVGELVVADVREAARRGEGRSRVLPDETIWGRRCRKVEFRFPADHWEDAVRRGETLWEVAARNRREMYPILHANRDRGVEDPDDVRAGDRVRVPRYHAGRVVLWVDAERHVPVRVLADDHRGRPYARYTHRDLRLNVGLTDADFDPDSAEYDF